MNFIPLNYLNFKISFTFLIESVGIIKAKYNLYLNLQKQNWIIYLNKYIFLLLWIITRIFIHLHFFKVLAKSCQFINNSSFSFRSPIILLVNNLHLTDWDTSFLFSLKKRFTPHKFFIKKAKQKTFEYNFIFNLIIIYKFI